MLGVALALASWRLEFRTSLEPPAKVLVEWRFEREGDWKGWQPNAHVAEVKVAEGALSFRTIGDDPILEFRPLLDLPASPWQAIEIRLKSDSDGLAEFFWSNTTEPPYGGFRPQKRTPFWVIGDNQWRTYRLFPFWHLEGKILRLRFDPPSGARVAIAFVRIVEFSVGQGVGETGKVRDWTVVGEAKLMPQREGWSVELQSPDAFLLTPVSVDAEANSFLSVRLSATSGKLATLFFACDQTNGLHTRTFPIVADGKEHTYSLDMLASTEWRGRIIAIGLRPTDAGGARAQIRWVRIGAEPQGAPELQIRVFALEDATPRAQVPTQLFAIVRNNGGEPVRHVRALLRLPSGVEISSRPHPIATLAFGEEVELRWRLVARRPLKGEAMVTVTAENAEPVTAKTSLHFPPRATIRKSPYVPKPMPVRGKYEVGVYYFPGWKSWSQWRPILPFPERKPVLGWYREGDPEVADWHIKWAVEHGITFFAYDWYWVKGARMLEHALHDGYLKARYRSLLKFCLLWANHNPPNTSSLEDCITVTRFWIERYFRLPEYFTVDGKPVVIIFSPHRLTEDMGSDGVRKAFEAMRQECVNHGLKGLYLVACVWNAAQALRAAQEGYDALSAYNWPTLGMKPSEQWSPFEVLADAYRRHYERLVGESPIPLLVPISGGWDSRPWHGESAIVRYGRTPQNFRRHLQDAKAFLDKYVPKGKALPITLIEAWNEWGEGSYIEPHAEFGFGYLDAIREIFTDAPRTHRDLAPVDVGLGPYEVVRFSPDKTAWEFEREAEGWESGMQLVDVRVQDGCLTGRTTGSDPAFLGPPVQIRASQWHFVLIRLRLTKLPNAPKSLSNGAKDTGQLFWQTVTIPESEATSVRFEVRIDGQWHEYRLPVHENKRWRGAITRLRLDPCTQPNVLVEVDYLRLTK